MTTSDAKAKQSVEKCEYNHDWVSVPCGYSLAPDGYICRVCDYAPKRDSKLWGEADSLLRLRSILKPGDTVYTILNHVSRSGMCRRISCVIGEGKDVRNITWDVARALGETTKNRAGYVQDVGIEQGGCGMDMGFNLVYNLSSVLFRNFVCSGKDCPSNDHTNGDRDHKPHKHSDGGYALKQRWI